jgi:hypothetical protein
MMTSLLVVAFLLGQPTLSSGANTSGKHAMILDQELQKKYESFEKTLAEERNALAFLDGEEVRNCVDYLRAKKTSRLAEGVNNMNISQEYLICDLLDVVRRSKPIAGYRPTSYGEELYRRLDLRTFRSTLRQRLNDEITLSQIKSGRVTVGKDSVDLEFDDWRINFKVVASLDINGEQKTDWIVWLADESKLGNYKAYSTLIIRNIDKKNLLKATE